MSLKIENFTDDELSERPVDDCLLEHHREPNLRISPLSCGSGVLAWASGKDHNASSRLACH
jgi:hypothetical protein